MTELFTSILKSPRLRPVRDWVQAVLDKKAVDEAHRRVESAYVDPRVVYPSYKSLDDYIDLERLKRLDGYITERLQRRHSDAEFWTGPYTAGTFDKRRPGSKMISLTTYTIENSYNYFDLDKADRWAPSAEAEEFAEVMDFVRALPFKSTGRIMIMYDFSGSPVTAHRDHDRDDMSHEFLWLRTSLAKPFYLMDQRTKERKYVETYSAWFDTVNQFHGADAAPGLSFSLRVDGIFTDELRARIPVPERNLASTPSFWAALGDRTN